MLRILIFTSCLTSNFFVSSMSRAEALPANIKWLTNDTDPEYADLNAKRGGTFNYWIQSFPATMRLNGPDSNGVFAGYLRPLQLSLIGIHPNSENIIPQLATHWAYGEDGKTMYFKLNPDATWSDGKKVTADDFVFSMEFGQSKVITDPFTNDYWQNELKRAFKIDESTIGVEAVNKKPKSDLHMYCNMTPTPKHFFGGKLPAEYVQTYNWKPYPSTAAYVVDKVNKGKSVTFKRRKDWFLDKARFYRGRFNVDTIQFDVVREINVAWEMFKKGKLAYFPVINPSFWHDKANDPAFTNGYINKLWFYVDQPQSPTGIWINSLAPILSDRNVRLGLSHSMNIDAVIEKMLRGEYEHLDQHYVGYGKYTDSSIKARRFDLKLADDYFKKAGWVARGGDGIRVKDGQRLSFTLIYDAEILNGRMAFLKEEAKKAGVELKLQLMDGGAAFKQAREKKHELVYSAWSTGMRPEFHQHYYSDLAGKPQNNSFTNTKDPEIDKYIDKLRASSDEAERIELSKKLQNLIHEQAAFIPTFSLPFYRDAYWRWFRLPAVPGVRLGDSSMDSLTADWGGLFWIDEDLRKETLAAMKSGKTFKQSVVVDTTYKIKK